MATPPLTTNEEIALIRADLERSQRFWRVNAGQLVVVLLPVLAVAATWGDLRGAVNDHERRIAAVEREEREIHTLSERMARIETKVDWLVELERGPTKLRRSDLITP